MPVVTFSRMLGTNGDAVAETVARQLEARLINKASIFEAARQSGVSATTLAEIQSDAVMGLADRILMAVRTMPMLPRARGGSLLDAPLPMTHQEMPAGIPTQFELDQGARVLERVVRGLAEGRNVVIVGRAAHMILRDRPNVVRVQIVAPVDYRVTVISETDNVDRREALARIRASDKSRGDYLRRYYNAGWTDPVHFDLVLNSQRTDTDLAARLIVTLVQARLEQASPASPSEG